MAAVVVGATPLTLEQLVAVARDHAPVDLAPKALEGMRASLAWVNDVVAGRLSPDPAAPPEAIYSINTGFGSLAGTRSSVPSRPATSPAG